MTAYQLPRSVLSPWLELGDDVYAKPLDPWRPDPEWLVDHVHADPVIGQLLWRLQAGANGLQREKAYAVFRNANFRSCAFNDVTDVITCVGHNIQNATLVYFRGGKLPDELVVGAPYYACNRTADTFQIKDNSMLTGNVIDFTTEGGGSSVVASSWRSSSDQLIETFDALDVAQLGEAESTQALLDLLQADQIIEESSGVYVLRTYLKGTNTELIPAKHAKQPGGSALTNPVTERLAGYRE